MKFVLNIDLCANFEICGPFCSLTAYKNKLSSLFNYMTS